MGEEKSQTAVVVSSCMSLLKMSVQRVDSVLEERKKNKKKGKTLWTHNIPITQKSTKTGGVYMCAYYVVAHTHVGRLAFFFPHLALSASDIFVTACLKPPMRLSG